MNKTILIIMASVALAGLTRATTITVGITVGPDAGYDFATIQAGIDASVDGDTVLVAPGEYVITEPISFQGKAITVISETGPEETTIRMGTPTDTNRGSVIVFEKNETDASVLQGFTITGGRGCWHQDPYGNRWSGWTGGGILCWEASPTIVTCTAIQNRADHGGGVLCLNSHVTLTDCIIAENSAEYGGGINSPSRSSPILTNCTIRDNSATQSAGGVESWDNSSVTMTDCTITENSAGQYGGGGMCDNNSSMIMTNCNITDNASVMGGGAIVCSRNSSMTTTDCIMIGNMAGSVGGAIECAHSSSGTFINCTITCNTAAWGGGGLACAHRGTLMIVNNCTIWGNSAGSSYGGGGVGCFVSSSAEITNSIIHGNTSPMGEQIALTHSGLALTVAYSNVDGGQEAVYVESSSTLNWDEGNIDADPLFAEPGHWADINDPNIVVEPDDPNVVWVDGDYHLKSEAGRWDPISKSWVLDAVTSPCIDRGDPNSPVGEEPDPNGGIVNMGAYGGTPEASMSIGQLAPLPTPIPLVHWKLDETEGMFAADSAGENEAVVVGGVVWQPDGGQVDGALLLDGVSGCAITNPVLNPADDPFSIFAWVKGGAPGQVVVSQQSAANWLALDAEGNLMTELKGTNRSTGSLFSETAITDGQWHRIGFVWDGSNRTLCVDGVAVAEDTQPGLDGSQNGLYIGVDKNYAAGTFFSGLIDDVRIYNRVVSP
jgi:hypothetical protein